MGFSLLLAAFLRKDIAALVAEDILLLESARADLRTAAALLGEPGDAAEILYIDLFLAAADGGVDPLGPAPALLVRALFDGPGPLRGSIREAAGLVKGTFEHPAPPGEGHGEPLRKARDDLAVRVPLKLREAVDIVGKYLDGYSIHGKSAAARLCRDKHAVSLVQVDECLSSLQVVIAKSVAAHGAVSRCQGGQRPGEHIDEAEWSLQRTLREIEDSLHLLRAFQKTLAEIEDMLLIVTAAVAVTP